MHHCVDGSFRLPPDVPGREPRYTYEELNGHRMTTIRVLLVDDTPQVRRDLRSMLTLCEGIEVVGEAGNGQEAVEMTRTLKPDVVLMDLEMPALDGFEASTRIKRDRLSARVVALTIHDDEDSHRRASQAGIDAFIVKGAALEELLGAIRA